MFKKIKAWFGIGLEPESESEPLKIHFEDGWADNMDFESTEEAKEFEQMLIDKLQNMTPEQLEAESRPVSELSLEEQKDIFDQIENKNTRH